MMLFVFDSGICKHQLSQQLEQLEGGVGALWCGDSHTVLEGLGPSKAVICWNVLVRVLLL